jgi:hypothetical protein
MIEVLLDRGARRRGLDRGASETRESGLALEHIWEEEPVWKLYTEFVLHFAHSNR